MRFISLTGMDAADRSSLSSEYKAAHVIGTVHLGELRLYFRTGFKTYYIAYRDVSRCFRRVMLIPARPRSGRDDLRVETVVICKEKSELAQIQLPGEKAAKALMEELERRIPEAEFGKPPEES